MRRFMRIAALVGAGLPGLAQANLFDIHGAGARSQALGGAGVAVTADAYATYINPAGLAHAPRMLDMGMSGAFNRSSITLMKRPSGYDTDTYRSLRNPRQDTEDDGSNMGFGVGLSVPLFIENLTLGGLVFMPLSGFANADTSFSDERQQYFSNQLNFEITGDRVEGEIFAAALGYRLADWISIGIGLLVLPENSTNTEEYVKNAADMSDMDVNVKLDQSARRALLGGVIVKPLDWLRVGLSFQDEIYFRIGVRNVIQISGQEGDEPSLLEITAVEHYVPPKVSLGLALIDQRNSFINIETTWRGWSRYLNNHGEKANFNDTFEFRLNGEYGFENYGVLRAGVGYVPTPVPDQTGRTNYVDNDRLLFALGAGRDFELFGIDLTIDFAMQLQLLLQRDTYKKQLAQIPLCAEGVEGLCDEVRDDAASPETLGLQTGNPGFPGFSSGGYILAASIDLKWRF